MEPDQLLSNQLLVKMRNGEVVSSMTVKLVKGGEIAQIAKTAGFDSIYVDLEHSSFSIETTAQVCLAALFAGIPAFVRIPANTAEWIARVLDSGALGIIAPHISSAQEAKEVVRFAKFPPMGERSSAGALAHFQYRTFPASKAYPVLNASTMVTVQFEDAKAIENAEEIISVPGVDMVLIGTNDMTADMGISGQYDHPLVTNAYQKTIDLCKKYNKFCGVGGLSSRPDLVAKFVQMGARYVSTGTDLAFLMGAATDKAKQISSLNQKN